MAEGGGDACRPTLEKRFRAEAPRRNGAEERRGDDAKQFLNFPHPDSGFDRTATPEVAVVASRNPEAQGHPVMRFRFGSLLALTDGATNLFRPVVVTGICVWICVVSTLAVTAAPPVPVPGYYAGRLGDGRSIQLLLLREAGADQPGSVQIGGDPYSVTLTQTKRVGETLELGIQEDAASERGCVKAVTVSTIVTQAPIARVSGMLRLKGEPSAVSFEAERSAELGRLNRKRGLRLLGRGGGKSFQALWPVFPTRVPFHQAVSERFRSEADGGARGFTSGSHEVIWEGLKDPGAAWDWEGSVEVRVVTVRTNLLSTRELRYEYTGGAHGMASWTGRNFVFEAGKARELKLPEFFAPRPDWTNQVSVLALRELRRQEAGWTLDTTPPELRVSGFTEADLASFNLEPGGLILHFSDYAVGSHAEGLYSVLIPWKDLEGVVVAERLESLGLRRLP